MKAGWHKKKLGEVCELVNGRAYRKPELLSEGKYKVLRVGNFFTNENWYYSDLELEDKKYCDNGDLLYAWSASFGPRVWTGEKVIFHYHIWKVIPDFGQIDQQFLFYFLEWDKELLKLEKGAGTTMIHVSKGSMEEREILVPPLAEQQRIVAILDEAFEAITAARTNAEQNRQNARALFESYLQSVFSQRGDGWINKPLSELCDIKHGFAFKSEYFTNEGDYTLLTPGNFFETGGYRDRGDKQKFYSGDIPQGFLLEAGDLLVAMTEQAAGLLGSPIIVPSQGKFLHNQRLGLVSGKPGIPWLNEFFFHVFNTQAVRQAIHESASGAKVRHTSPTKIGAVTVALPASIEEQKAIVATLDTLTIETQRLESLYQRKIAALDELKQSLLHQAFSGNL